MDGQEKSHAENFPHSGADLALSREQGTGCRQGEVKINRITGAKYIDGPRRLPRVICDLKFHVPNLRAYYDSTGLMIEFELRSDNPIDDADARDAQCRAGWPDVGYGFYAFTTKENVTEFVASWSCGRFCE